jgi:hypothetical protein
MSRHNKTPRMPKTVANNIMWMVIIKNPYKSEDYYSEIVLPIIGSVPYPEIGLVGRVILVSYDRKFKK